MFALLRWCLRWCLCCFCGNKGQNRILVSVLQRAQHAQEADGEKRAVERVSEVHAGEEERVGGAEAALGGVRDFCG